MSHCGRSALLGLGVAALVGTSACGRSKRSATEHANGTGGAAAAGTAGEGARSNHAGQTNNPGDGAGGIAGSSGGSATGGRATSGSGNGGSDTGSGGNGGSASGDGGAGGSGAGGAAGSGGADDECRAGQTRYAPGCTYAPLPSEGCYASCENGPCARGECLVVSVPTPTSGGIIAPDAQCGERHALCIDTPLCVAAGQINWDYIAAASSARVLRSSIDAASGPEGKLRLYDLTGGNPVAVCAVDLSPCAGDGVDLDDVNRALANPEMQTFLRVGGLYGHRGDSGSVLRIVAEDASVEVGAACNGESGCRPIEPPLDALATMLRSLTDAALAGGRCSGAPPLP